MADHGDFAALERAQWSDADLAGAYARDFAKAAEHCVPHFVRAVAAGPGCEALDLCCGHGIVARGLADAGARVSALDFSPAMLEMARALVPEAQVFEGDAMALPFGEASFDAVTIGFGIPHVPDPAAVLAEARRVLRPGGRLAYTVWHADPEISSVGIVFGAIAAHGDPSISLPPGPDAFIRSNPDVSLLEMRELGFREVRLETVPSCWETEDPGAPFDFFLEGTARGGALLRPQPEANKAAIRAAVVAGVTARWGQTGPWTIPTPAAMVSGTA